MVRITVSNLTKTFQTEHGRLLAADNVNFEVPDGRIFTLLGPSGSGKTTTLRSVAGLETPDEGRIEIGDKAVYSSHDRINVPPEKRNIGMVFQSYAIWPHMNVFDNVAYPLKIKNVPRNEVRRRVKEVLAIVRLEGLEQRAAVQLSGGEQQRVALARALVRGPDVLLLDEPLSNLDAKVREHVRAELKELQRSLGITTIYVTHDQLDALALSDLIAVMDHGRVLELEEPKRIYERPRVKFVADFIGVTNLVRGKIVEKGTKGEFGIIETRHGQMLCVIPDELDKGDEALLSIRPENVTIHKEPPNAKGNVFEGRVRGAQFLGAYIECRVLVGDQEFRVYAQPSENINDGERVFLHLNPAACALIKP